MRLQEKTKLIQRHVGAYVDGVYGTRTADAILAKLGDNGGPSLFDREEFLSRYINRNAPAISNEDITLAAKRLGVPAGHIHALRKVESNGVSFDNSGRPIILPEPHIFYRETGGRFGITPFSYPKWGTRSYPKSYDARWQMLADMAELDEAAALRSASIGLFQVMGFNYAAAGYSSVHKMWEGMTADEDDHLEAMVSFILAEGLDDELRACRAGDPASCVPFVSRYNGPGYKKNNYHVKFAKALQ